MTRVFLLIIIISWTIASNAQSVDNRINYQIESLRLSKVDTFLIYSFPCIGGLIPTDTCAIKRTQYLLWKQNGNFLLKRIDYCKNYKPISLDTSNPLSFYLTYQRQIDKEEIKPPTYIQSKKGNTAIEISTDIDHTCFHEITVLCNRKTTFKSVSDYNLQFIMFDNGKKNIYYNRNKRTKLKALIDKLDKLALDLETVRKFEVD